MVTIKIDLHFRWRDFSKPMNKKQKLPKKYNKISQKKGCSKNKLSMEKNRILRILSNLLFLLFWILFKSFFVTILRKKLLCYLSVFSVENACKKGSLLKRVWRNCKGKKCVTKNSLLNWRKKVNLFYINGKVKWIWIFIFVKGYIYVI